MIKTEEKTLFYRKGSTISVINGQELITIPIVELNLRVDILRKQTIDEFVEKCVGEMKQWYWNEELHSNIKILQQFISPEKDVDGFRKDSLYNPCTPQGIIDWLEVNDIDLRGKLVTVLGRSDIVGKPLVNMLIDKGATVISCNSKTQKYHMENFMKMSDIVISAIGKPKKFDSSYFGIDTIIIDVGINRDENGKLCGDIDQKDVEDYFGNCCYVTPVPGGVGLLTRVTLLKNVMK